MLQRGIDCAPITTILQIKLADSEKCREWHIRTGLHSKSGMMRLKSNDLVSARPVVTRTESLRKLTPSPKRGKMDMLRQISPVYRDDCKMPPPTPTATANLPMRPSRFAIAAAACCCGVPMGLIGLCLP